jgi:signal transduction histidine kinase
VKIGDVLTIRRAWRELLYSLLGSLAGILGFVIVLFTVVPGVGLSVTIVGTLPGLLLVTVSLRLAFRLGGLHRRLLARLLGQEVAAPAPAPPGSGILNRLDRRLRYRPGWRAVWYCLVKLPVAVLQAYAVAFAVCGLIDMDYPVLWLLFHRAPHGGTLGPMVAITPLGFVYLNISNWPETFLAVMLGVVCLAAGYGLALGMNTADRRLIVSLLGPSSMTERVMQLERSRAVAVDDSAAALRRVERDLHDGAQMRLAALAMNLGMAQEKLGGESDTVRELLSAAQRNAADALADLRDIARGIHPPALDSGLAVALESLAASSAIPATVTAGIPATMAEGRPSPAIETIAYFCAAELLANSIKHSYANQIKIEIYSERRGVLGLRISDDGIGGAGEGRGSGLAGLAQRVSTVDGEIGISSPAGGPTVVTVELPLRAQGEGTQSTEGDGDAGGNRRRRRAAARGADPAAGGPRPRRLRRRRRRGGADSGGDGAPA